MCSKNTEDVNVNVFNAITRAKNQKNLQNMYDDLNFMVENVIQIKSGIRVNVEASPKIRGNVCAKR